MAPVISAKGLIDSRAHFAAKPTKTADWHRLCFTPISLD